MKQAWILVLLLVLAATSAWGVQGRNVGYVGGTAPELKPKTLGTLDTEAALVFLHSGGKLVIPFDKIESFDYWDRRARQLGVLPTIAVGLFKRLQRKHFFRIAYRDQNDMPQAAVFEVPKHMPEVLSAVLKARVQEKSKGAASSACTGK